MDNPSNLTSCNFNHYSPWQTTTVLWAPVYGCPVYAIAIFLLKYYSDTQSAYIRCAQLLAIILNFLELTVMSTLFFPQFQVPVLGLQVGGVMEDVYPRVIFYIIVALVIHHGINTTTLFIAHCRLILLSRSLVLRKISMNMLLGKCHQLSCLNYILMIVSVGSILLLFNVDSLENQIKWKNEFYLNYQLEFIWCPKFQVLDPTAWEFAVMMCVACSVTLLFAIIFVMCSVTTILIVQSAKESMSVQTIRYHLQVVTSFLISCAIQAFFVVLPVIHMLICVYSDFFKVYTGGLIYYSLLTQAHQGTAFTLFYAELESFKMEVEKTRVPSGADPSTYWISKKTSFPLLYSAAVIVLAIPSSSCSTERLFSRSGRIVANRYRNRVSAQTCSSLLMAQASIGFERSDSDILDLDENITDEELE